MTAREKQHYMSRISEVFKALRKEGKRAFMPFLTAGDPNLDFTVRLMHTLADEGCSLLEIGIPYSDPIADGPVIQASYTRALTSGIRLSDIFRTFSQTLPKLPVPAVAMVSYAIVLRHGLDTFLDRARDCGLAGLIVPDLPIEECGELRERCLANGLDLVQLVTPTTPRNRAVAIAQLSTGFLYYVSVAGITGERNELPPSVVENVTWLRQQTPLPVCVGFGVSRPEHVRMIAAVADGIIVGSAFVRRIAEVPQKGEETVIHEIRQFARSLITAMSNQ